MYAHKPFMMFETNTASSGGFLGISDSFLAALWHLDHFGLSVRHTTRIHDVLNWSRQSQLVRTPTGVSDAYPVISMMGTTISSSTFDDFFGSDGRPTVNCDTTAQTRTIDFRFVLVFLNNEAAACGTAAGGCMTIITIIPTKHWEMSTVIPSVLPTFNGFIMIWWARLSLKPPSAMPRSRTHRSPALLSAPFR
ncbi:hypothetical protein K438DRAFT_1969147 [Mycena galopus ATCC 62051]|nr:hypothetical protein K438DRAFT_1969147 [Mycena galopus ATCC 62051]